MAEHIPVIKFYKRKYGDELLVDIVTLDTIRNSPTFAEVMRQAFYGLMLTTGGEADGEGLRGRREGIVDNVVYDSSIHGAVVVLNPRTGALLALGAVALLVFRAVRKSREG